MAGPDAAALIVESPDAAVADALGFAADAAYDGVIRIYMEDDA